MTTVRRARREGNTFGRVLGEWRRKRGLSQLDLTLGSGVSQRHISFLESGRSRPSRDMVLRLATVLDIPLRAHNISFLRMRPPNARSRYGSLVTHAGQEWDPLEGDLSRAIRDNKATRRGGCQH